MTARKSGDYIVLLHGIGRTKNTMLLPAWYFSWKGYEVINIDYQSRKKPIEALVEDIDKVIGARKLSPSRKVHFIGYSLGGLVIRAYLSKHRPESLGRVVMMGTPNNGSEVADFMKDYAIYHKLFGPAGQQLVTDQQKFRDIFGVVDYDLGIIAGRLTVDPISTFLIIPGANDGRVSVESTKLGNMKDHIVVNASHALMVNNPGVIRQARHFIEEGRFYRKTPPAGA